jgi:hypothetical protein
MSDNPYEVPRSCDSSSTLAERLTRRTWVCRVISVMLAFVLVFPAVASNLYVPEGTLTSIPDSTWNGKSLALVMISLALSHPITSLLYAILRFETLLIMPFGWFAEWFFYGWLLDTWIYRRRLKNAVKTLAG